MSEWLTHQIFINPPGTCRDRGVEHSTLEITGIKLRRLVKDIFVLSILSISGKSLYCFIAACLPVHVSSAGVFKSTRRRASHIAAGWRSRGAKRAAVAWGAR